MREKARRLARRGDYEDDSVSTSDESTDESFDNQLLQQQNFEQFVKKEMVQAVLRVNETYLVSFEVLYLAFSCIERYLDYVAERFEFSLTTDQNLKEFKLSSLIILNLASKFYDRVAYCVSDLIVQDQSGLSQ